LQEKTNCQFQIWIKPTTTFGITELLGIPRVQPCKEQTGRKEEEEEKCMPIYVIILSLSLPSIWKVKNSNILVPVTWIKFSVAKF